MIIILTFIFEKKDGNLDATVTIILVPAPSFSYPDTKIIGTSDVTQALYLSNLYPVGYEIGIGTT